ncbi:MAG: ACP S-malonyltransferase [Firmicutes bacterium]|jgi:[acyl-carrier-protein] S-malonyltransferase|nr:ACP S-malonyltransferase [Bacillota bacterium]
MGKTAVLFPGQGSQFVGMGKLLFQEFPEFRSVFQEAEELLPGMKISTLCFDGPDEDLRLTLNAQPAIFTVSAGAYQIFKKQNLSFDYVAGHSVGEYAALVAAGVFSFKEGLHLVRKRGELMYESGVKRQGTMAAVLGLDERILEQVCLEVSKTENKIVEIANLNTPSQIVISGDPDAVKKAGEMAKEKGAKRIVPLSVSGAFHSALMEDAALELGQELDKVKFLDPAVPVVSNVSAKAVKSGLEIKELLKKQIRKKVRWEESIRCLIQEGVSLFIEMEPGSVLTGLVKSIDKTVKTAGFKEIMQGVKSA